MYGACVLKNVQGEDIKFILHNCEIVNFEKFKNFFGNNKIMKINA